MANVRPSIVRPSAVVKLALRLEEFDDTGELVARLPNTATDALPAAQTGPQPQPGIDPGNDPAQLRARLAEIDDTIASTEQMPEDGFFSEETRRDLLDGLRDQRDELTARLEAQGANVVPADAPPDWFDGPPADDRVVLGNILPRSVEIERNGLRTADTCTVVINHTDAPFDPRLIRAAAIEVTLGVADPADYERGMRGQTRDDGLPYSVAVPRGPRSTRFVGVVDSWSISMDESEGDAVTLECRDLSAILFDTPLATGSAIDLTLPIDHGIQALLDSYPTSRGVVVRYVGGGDGQAGEAPIPARAAPTQTAARRGRVSRQHRSGDTRMTLWDHITDTCTRVGVVPIFVDYELRIVDPRTFYDTGARARRMVYGRNLAHLEFSRKLGGTKVPTIEVRSYDPAIGRTRWARYPVQGADPRAGILGQTDPATRPQRANETTLSGHAPDERIQTYLVRGVTDGEALYRVARSLFEQIGRQEIEGNFATNDTRSFEADGPIDGIDLLQLDVGEPIELLVAGGSRVPVATGALTVAELQALSRQSRAAYLESIGWSEQVAQRFAALQDATGFQTVFRTQTVKLSWDLDEGLKVTGDFINYITVREGSAPTTTEDRPQPDPAPATSLDVSPRLAYAIGRAMLAGTEEAGALLRAVSARATLDELREGGAISDATYQRDAAAADELVAERLVAFEEG